uniref:Chromosome 11 open reading frame 16 n=1 Tax=Dromaius novaehollandiae TaxID=8790 RepID=A0A8C4JKV3_DRONO
MACSKGFLPTNHKYCSAMTALDKFSCYNVISTVSPCCRNSLLVHPAWITKPLTPWSRCLLSPDAAWKRPSVLARSAALASNVPVLVRGERDGFYYRGTVKEELESEGGMFLVEFAKPLVAHGKCPVSVQKTTQDDILEYVDGMKHSLLPGDKVLAPWEPDMVRYGPGTVLMGVETRDPLRASEDEEITVRFWNGKKRKLPLGVALWIPPSRWERTVEMIHMPFTSRLKPRENPDANSCIFSCSPVTVPIPLCTVDSLTKRGLLCWPHFHCHCGGGICCSSVPTRCICCCHPHADAWWPLPSRSLVLPREKEEAEPSRKPSSCLLGLEGPKQEEAAAAAASSLSSDLERDLEPFPTKSTMMDSAVNTDSSLLEKPRLKESARPKWKYWKRSHHKSHPSNSGTLKHTNKQTHREEAARGR